MWCRVLSCKQACCSSGAPGPARSRVAGALDNKIQYKQSSDLMPVCSEHGYFMNLQCMGSSYSSGVQAVSHKSGLPSQKGFEMQSIVVLHFPQIDKP